MSEEKVKKKWKEMNKKERARLIGSYICIALIWIAVGLFIVFVIKPVKIDGVNAQSLPTNGNNDSYFNGLSQQYAGVNNYNELSQGVPIGYSYISNVADSITAKDSGASGAFMSKDGYLPNNNMVEHLTIDSYDPYAISNLGLVFLSVRCGGTPYPSGGYNLSILSTIDTLKDGSIFNTYYFCYLDSNSSDFTIVSVTLSNGDSTVSYNSLGSMISAYTTPSSVMDYYKNNTNVIDFQVYSQPSGWVTFLKLPLHGGQIDSRKLICTVFLDSALYYFDSNNISPVSVEVYNAISRSVGYDISFWETVGGNVVAGGGGVSQSDYNNLNGLYQNALNTIESLRAEIYNLSLQITTYRDTQSQLVTALGEATSRANTFAEQLAAYERIFANEEGAEGLVTEIQSLRNQVSDLVALNNQISQSEDDAWAEVERLIAVNNSLINSDGEHYQSIYQTGYDEGKIQGFREGRESVTEEELKNVNAIPSTIIGVVGAPVNFFREVLNFSILGINLFSFICSIVTLFLVSKLLKVVL